MPEHKAATMSTPDSPPPNPPDNVDPDRKPDDSVEPLLDELKQRVSDLHAGSAGQPAPAHEDQDIARRRAAAELLYQQASDTRAKALREHERATELREQLGRTEAEQRQARLDLDFERERIAGDRADLDAQRSQLNEELEQFEQRVATEAARVSTERRGSRTSALGVALRATLVAVVAGLAAGACWWLLQQESVHISQMTVTVENTPLETSAAAARLIGLPAGAFASQSQARAWQQAVGEGRVRIEPQADGQLGVALQGPGPVENEDLLSAAFAAYQSALVSAAEDRTRDVAWRTWEARRGLLATQLDAWQQRLGALQVQRREIPGEDQWRAARAQLDTLRAETRALTDELDQARSALVGLQSLDLPRGTLSTETFAAALLADPVYQQDMQELESQARAYQTEVLLGKVLVVDPLEELRKSVRGLAGAVEKQVELRPSVDVQAILEDAAAELDDLNRLLTQFAATWSTRRQEMELLRPIDDAEKLIAAQQAAFDSLARVTEEVERVLGVLRETVRRLGELPGGGTRESVVAAMLRGELSHLADNLREVRTAGRRLDADENFKLDATDRQVRSLRGRIRARQDRIQAELQATADEEARTSYERTVQARRSEISELDERRDQAMDAVVAQLEVLRELEGSSRALIGLDAEKTALEREVRSLEQRRDELLAAEPVPPVPTVTLASMQHAARDSEDLLRSTGLVAGSVFAATWMAAGLLMARFAGGRPTGPLEA